MKTVVAMYNNVADAERTVRDLVDKGVPRDQVSLVANNQGNLPGQEYVTPDETSGAAKGAGMGAGIGAALGGIGGLLVGLGALVIPGVGPVLAAGPLAAALGGIAGAIAGGATGGLVGALTDMGVTEQQAGNFTEGVKRGGVLVTVQAQDSMSPLVKDIMNRNNPVDMNDKAREWRQSGWTGYNPPSENYPTTSEMRNAPTGTMTPEMGTPGASVEPQTRSFERNLGTQNFDFYQEDFRNNFASAYGDRGYSYDQYAPAYRYGYDLATNERFRNQDWNTIEPDAQAYWEERHPGTWENFKDSIRYAWMRVKDTMS